MNKFWNWIKDDGQAPELIIDGTIAAESWFDDDVTPEMFRSELDAVDGDFTLWLNSPGGDCIAASQIYTMLMDHKGQVTVKIDGLAASAASVIAMAGTVVLMAPTALMMIHNPMTFAAGDYNEMQKAIDMLAEVKESIINAYNIKTGLSHAQLSHMMDDETWMNAKRAIELGFADGMLTDEKRTVDTGALEFSAKSVERAIACKLDAKKHTTDMTDTTAVPTEPPKPEGRSTDELRWQLYQRILKERN